MRVLFISNYFNHHQKPFCEAMYNHLGENFNFIETAIISEDRKSLGWGLEMVPSYVVSPLDFARNRERYQNLIDEADVVIIGSAPEEYIQRRKKNSGCITV